MRISIPRTKAEVQLDYHARRGQELPALNVKVYDRPEYMPDRIRAHFGCSQVAAEKAAASVYESEQEQFWEYDAPDAINYAMLGPDKSCEYEPTGLKPSPFSVCAEGRSGGWLVVEGLPPVSEWDGPTFQKWRKFVRLVRETIAYKLTFECARELIEANDWCPKEGTVAANKRDARLAPIDRLAHAALEIHGELDGKEWDGADCLERIAGHLRAAGLAIAEPQIEPVAAKNCTNFYEGSMGRCVYCNLQLSAHKGVSHA